MTFMAQLCLVLVILGIICLVIEMFVPGFGVFGISGIVLMVVAGVLAVMYVPYGWLIVAAEVVILIGMISFMVVFIKRRQLQGHLIMKENLNEDILPLGNLASLLGKEGSTVTQLRPFGVVDFNGTHVEATSNGPFIEKDIRVLVVNVDKHKVVVSAKAINQ